MPEQESPLIDFDLFPSGEMYQEFRFLFENAWVGFTPEQMDILKRAIEVFAKSLEGLAEPKATRIQANFAKHPLLWHWIVDWWYTKEAVERIPDVVDRFLKLSPILVGTTPSEEVNFYLREGTRCFLHGFFQAGVALSRAALEAGLDDQIRRKLTSLPTMKLGEKIDRAARLNFISAAQAGLAKEVSRVAGMVLHKKPVTEKQAFDTLIRTRNILLQMYAR